MGSIHKATTYFRRVVELSKPGEFTAELALIRLSELYDAQERYHEAIQCLAEAIVLRPDEAHYRLRQAELYVSIGELDTASSLAYDAASDLLIRKESLNLLYRIARARNDESAKKLARLLD